MVSTRALMSHHNVVSNLNSVKQANEATKYGNQNPRKKGQENDGDRQLPQNKQEWTRCEDKITRRKLCRRHILAI